MRTSTRLVVSTVVLGGGLLLASPVAAQEDTTTPCPYPFTNCPTTPAPIGGENENPATGETPAPAAGEIGGENENPATGETPAPTVGGIGGGNENPATGETPAPTVGGIGGGGGGPAIVDQSPARGDVGGAASLPFTGGEVTLIALAGTATLAAGVALVAAGRKRATA